jgi:flagellar biosynthesis anti-sigma factor FlgM
MKIENSNMLPISAKPAEAANSLDKKTDANEVHSVRSGQDRVEMSEDARLLSKARVALGNVQETGSEYLLTLKNQIQSGNYKVQVSDLARKLLASFYPK